ncbi:MAG: serine hydrolase domain-containing protein, partial [Myxococcota bacterium]
MWIVVWLIGCMEPDDAVVDRTTDPVFTEVVSWTLDRMDEWHVPGVAIGVLIDGELTHRAGLGVRRFGTNARINSNTRFRVGSISKMFTGAALLQQAEMGRIDLDAPASRALPGVTLADPLALSKPTLMQLLTHSGGMQPPGLPRRCDVDETALSGELLERAREWSLWSEPGTFFHYANPNYALGGLAVEIAADEPFAALM